MNQATLVSPARRVLSKGTLQQSPTSAPFVFTRYHKNQSIPQKTMMRITVDVASVSELRKIIVSTCGDLILYLRVKPVEHARKMQFCLCLSKASTESVIGNVMRVLPKAEFGRITALSIA